ncbi:uncharacterized protein CC84DRAFT_1263082 [Paraphaeosphaeria sporulosa]|uniref:Uncharacterized protein n=1 Tax=Paraphaeosphaeria sporulosa TaxID=1460663 RepID=A0A177C2D5_9PLEO|nr:uncharacterized protein CC84DRAFT_1263082 [Paraphaeosphaeria sporulosa]OAG01022.1 hypothetical protein CC84DRAFT_1263082 [Paraphaeosphaeria sporulosa]
MPDRTAGREGAGSLSFRFLDLPPELRDKIYQELLCDFKAAPSLGVNDVVEHKPCGYYVRTIHTAILRANQQIHLEAYDIMVKTNRFVHIKFFGGLPLDHMLETSTRRVICHHLPAVEAFKGYTMSVSVVPEGLAWWSPEDHHLVTRANSMAVHCMILGEDCAGLIRTLGNVHMPNLNKTLNISIAVAPYLQQNSPEQRELLEPFFKEPGTQEKLLAPFRAKLRGVEDIKIIGVDPSLASAIKEEIAKDEWTDSQTVLFEIQTAKQRGNDLFKAKELRAASQTWEEAVNDIERMHQSSSWKNLCVKGDTAFVDAMVELYFLMCLNITHVQLTGIDKPIPGYPRTHDAHVYLSLAEQQIDRVMNARQPNWWRKDYVWEPSDAQLAKLFFRQAMCRKADALLNGEPICMVDAIRTLELARQIVPDDAAIKREAESMEHEYERMLFEAERDVTPAQLFGEFGGDYEDEEDGFEDEDDFDDMPELLRHDESDEDFSDMPDTV